MVDFSLYGLAPAIAPTLPAALAAGLLAVAALIFSANGLINRRRRHHTSSSSPASP